MWKILCKYIFNPIWGLLVLIYTPIKNFLVFIGRIIADFFSAIWNVIKIIITPIYNFVKYLFVLVKNLINGIKNGIISFFKVLGNLVNKFK